MSYRNPLHGLDSNGEQAFTPDDTGIELPVGEPTADQRPATMLREVPFDTEQPEPPCGARYGDQLPCGKRAGHENGPETDWKRDYHSNGSLKWRSDQAPATEPALSSGVKENDAEAVEAISTVLAAALHWQELVNELDAPAVLIRPALQVLDLALTRYRAVLDRHATPEEPR